MIVEKTVWLFLCLQLHNACNQTWLYLCSICTKARWGIYRWRRTEHFKPQDDHSVTHHSNLWNWQDHVFIFAQVAGSKKRSRRNCFWPSLVAQIDLMQNAADDVLSNWNVFNLLSNNPLTYALSTGVCVMYLELWVQRVLCILSTFSTNCFILRTIVVKLDVLRNAETRCNETATKRDYIYTIELDRYIQLYDIYRSLVPGKWKEPLNHLLCTLFLMPSNALSVFWGFRMKYIRKEIWNNAKNTPDCYERTVFFNVLQQEVITNLHFTFTAKYARHTFGFTAPNPCSRNGLHVDLTPH